MTAPADRPRPLSTAALPPSPPLSYALGRKYSLDHGESSHLSWRSRQSGSSQVTLSPEEPPPTPPEEEKEENAFVANGNKKEEDINQNMPLGMKIRCKKVLKKQSSFESCDDNYLYDFFDRNCRPDGAETTSENNPSENVELERENNNVEPCKVEGASRVRRNVNVRPRSWLTSTSTARVEDPRRIRRRQTDPCGSFISDYERALSSLLYQPYECRNENTSISSNFDDSDVGYWLSSDSSRWNREERCYSSSSSSSTSSSSLGELVRRWGSSKDPSTQSIRALLSGKVGNTAAAGERVGNSAESSDPNSAGVPTATGSDESAQSSSRHGREMLVNVETETQTQTRDLSDNVLSGSENNSGGVSVNCYRAVPATVASIPSVQCNNNVSNVRIVQRTFTSTEAQTDDVLVDQVRATNRDREQRRRERRERRHQRRLANHLHPQIQNSEVWHTPVPEPIVVDRLPDILNSHLPPPYSTLPLGLPPPLPPVPPPVVTTVPGSPPQQGLRFPFAIVPVGRRRSRLSPHFASEDQPKSCCGVSVSQTLTVRWFIILIFLVGLCCAVVGTVLGAMKATGREHLTVSLLMIGVGIVLVAVSGVAWRLTSQQAPSCRAMLGLGGDETGGEPNRRFVPRLPPSYGRPHHPYAAMMYPEFQYRAPPPSYQASMQEYRLRLLLLDRHSGTVPGNTVSPPPTYRSQAGSLLRAPIGLRGRETHTPSQSEYSRPPSYRSRTSSRPDPSQISHSREPSGSEAGQAVNVITVHPHIIKLAPSPPLPAKGGKDSNLVTIVQTASQPTGPVIVTISGQDDGSTSHCQQTEMEILAHL